MSGRLLGPVSRPSSCHGSGQWETAACFLCCASFTRAVKCLPGGKLWMWRGPAAAGEGGGPALMNGVDLSRDVGFLQQNTVHSAAQ